MSKSLWGLSLAVLASAFQACVPRHVYDAQVSEMNEAISQKDKEIAELRRVKFENERLMAENQLLQVHGRAFEELSKDIKEALEALQKEGIERNAKTGEWTLGTDLLFRSGTFDITPEGARLIKRFVSIWGSRDVKFRVVGHTDTDPIHLVKKQVKSELNLELGLLRAFHVAHSMIKDGVKERNLWIESKGMSDPAVPGNSADAKRKNRRVAIFVYDNATGTPLTGSK